MTTQRNHGLCLSLSDHDRIKIFVHELGYRGLLQYIEKLMRYFNDQVLYFDLLNHLGEQSLVHEIGTVALTKGE